MIDKNIIDDIVKELAGQEYVDELDFSTMLRKISNKHKIAPMTKATLISNYRQLLKDGILPENKRFSQLLTKRSVRTMSGVSVITVLSKPFACPGKCVYCPTEPEMPKSYLSNEPAAMRAKLNLFDGFRQVTMRIKALENNGHEVDKLEVLILGGTWSVYPEKYQQEFVRDLFYAANIFGQTEKRKKLSLAEEQKINEDAKYKIIGLTLETRPDFINEIEIKKMRTLGCTRVQLGVQHTDNKILDLIQRGHTIEQSIKATRLLKEVGLKVDHHYMPDLPGSTPAKDLEMMKYVFSSPDLQPDQLKIYPCIVNEFAELNTWLKEKKYKPYSETALLNLLLEIKKITPPYIRINRLIRDIPEESIIAGNKVTNLRQALQQKLKEQGQSCKCLRCREVRGEEVDINQIELVARVYKASQGTEYFLSFENKDKSKVYAFLRLRINDAPEKNIFPELENTSLVRELHVYGKMIPVTNDETDDDSSTTRPSSPWPDAQDFAISKTQHLGLGKRLMARAEGITKEQDLNKIAVIAGIGVRNYYKKLGYELEGTYMTKILK